jgi:hypothetical protein
MIDPRLVLPPGSLVSLAADCVSDHDEAKIAGVVHVLTLLMGKQLSHEEAAARLEELIGTTQAIEKLEALLTAPAPSFMLPPQLAGRHKPRRWTAEEDSRLVEAVKVHGCENWTQIAGIIGGDRTRSQCAQRWHRGVNPKISKSNWSAEEEQKLIDLVKVHGDKAWTRIAHDLGDRADVQCRFRYRFLLKRAAQARTEVKPVSVPKVTLDAALESGTVRIPTLTEVSVDTQI